MKEIDIRVTVPDDMQENTLVQEIISTSDHIESIVILKPENSWGRNVPDESTRYVR